MTIKELFEEYVFGDKSPGTYRCNFLSDLLYGATYQRMKENQALKPVAISDRQAVLNESVSLTALQLDYVGKIEEVENLVRTTMPPGKNGKIIDPDPPCPLDGLWAAKGLKYVLLDFCTDVGLSSAQLLAKANAVSVKILDAKRGERFVNDQFPTACSDNDKVYLMSLKPGKNNQAKNWELPPLANWTIEVVLEDGGPVHVVKFTTPAIGGTSPLV